MRSPKYWFKDLVYGACWIVAGRRYQGVQAILLYHSVGSKAPLSVPTRDFERQVAYLRENFGVVLLRNLPEVLAKAGAGNPVAGITFDDGLLDNYEHALPILEKYGVKASFFIPTGAIGGTPRASYDGQPHMTAVQLREMASLGHEIGAHTVTHPKLTQLMPQQAWQEITDSKTALEDLLGKPVASFAYPKGDYNEAVKQMVYEVGLRFAATTREALVDGDIDWLALPRVWMNPTMGWVQFHGKLSLALSLYERMRGRKA